MLDALAGRAVLFSDDIRCPIAVTDLAAAVLELVESDYVGLLNVTGLARRVRHGRHLHDDPVGPT